VALERAVSASAVLILHRSSIEANKFFETDLRRSFRQDTGPEVPDFFSFSASSGNSCRPPDEVLRRIANHDCLPKTFNERWAMNALVITEKKRTDI